MSKLGMAKAQGSVSMPGVLVLSTVTAVLVAGVIVVKLVF